MRLPPVLPWQTNFWQLLWQAKLKSRLPHALLLAGMAGLGKRQFADSFSRSLLCQQLNLDSIYCANCHACRLTEGRTHPNVLWIEPEKEGQAIKVDQIRTAAEFLNQSGLQGEQQFVIIHPAHHMNMNAANALLKTLEEPASGGMLILISDQCERLPATILSRCQRFTFTCPSKTDSLAWLKAYLDADAQPELLLNLSHGAPLAALKLADHPLLASRETLFQTLYLLQQKQADPLAVAADIQNIELSQFLDFILAWMMDLLKLQLGASAQQLMNSDFNQQLTELTTTLPIKKNLQFMDYILQLRAQINAGINFNKLLLIENILIGWTLGLEHVFS